jgi:formate hydrogenlyase transcriptional activator
MVFTRSATMIENDATFQRFNDLLLEMAHQHSLSELLSLVTTSLSSFLDVALVRIWLLQPADLCDRCDVEPWCRERTQCLHLVASAGRSIVDDTVWDETDGTFRRLGIGMRKVGAIAEFGEPLEVPKVEPHHGWIANPQWMCDEQISSFGGHPLVFRGQVLGVLIMFTRSPFDESEFFLLRMVADHLAYAIVNARAFEEIDTLKQQLEMENQYLRGEDHTNRAESRIFGNSEARNRMLERINLVAPTDASVLILGESGTGKELVAKEIHLLSSRSESPMIKVNCAAIPSELFASQFFGHVKGAFTGASEAKIGFFRAADGGTLFLDEVAEIPLSHQSILLRVLQDGEYQRVGDEKSQRVNVRIISATNQDLWNAVKKGKFRRDLYYRLNVFPVVSPPLRERGNDILEIAERFLQIFSKKMNKIGLTLSARNIEELIAYDWPGNVRELQNVIERAVITTPLESRGLDLPVLRDDADASLCMDIILQKPGILSDYEIKCFEKSNMIAALVQCNWKVYGSNGAAAVLGIKPTTFMARMKKYGINKREK